MAEMAEGPVTRDAPAGETAAAAVRGSLLVELSNAVVRVHKQFYGKGPTKARSHLSQDLLTVVLEGGYTRSEQTLHERGFDEQVLQSRLAMQGSVEGELRSAVEGILHRSVRSFRSATARSHEMQAEIFVLEPRGNDGPGDLRERA